MNKKTINLILSGCGKIPEYKTVGASGADLYSSNTNDIIINPLERKLIPTGIKIELLKGCEAQVRPRSGLSLKKGLVAIFGTIDSDYRGEVGIILVNLSNETHIIKRGERFAQLVFIGEGGLFRAEFKQVDNFNKKTERGENGFGHTGK